MWPPGCLTSLARYSLDCLLASAVPEPQARCSHIIPAMHASSCRLPKGGGMAGPQVALMLSRSRSCFG